MGGEKDGKSIRQYEGTEMKDKWSIASETSKYYGC